MCADGYRISRHTVRVKMGNTNQKDIIIVGGGLAGALLAQRLLQRRPELSVVLLQDDNDFQKKATWSFHRSDLSIAEWDWISPLVSKEWSGYTVRFPAYARDLTGSTYCSIRSSEFYDRLDIIPITRFSAKVTSMASQSVYLEGGEFIAGRVVIDARGWDKAQNHLCGWQKFVGLDVELAEPHNMALPRLMDTTCAQEDGFRFFYVLPWSDTRLLIEDTRYSATSTFDQEKYIAEIYQYAQRQGWSIRRIERVEAASLPIPLLEPALRPPLEVPTIGMAGGFFHRVTGYSFPYAVRIADCISQLDVYTPSAVISELEMFRRKTKRVNEFSLLLNRMLFCAAKPEERRVIFARFYGLSEGLIQRFYAGQTSVLDMGRVLVGRPPVSVKRALRVVRSSENLSLC